MCSVRYVASHILAKKERGGDAEQQTSYKSTWNISENYSRYIVLTYDFLCITLLFIYKVFYVIQNIYKYCTWKIIWTCIAVLLRNRFWSQDGAVLNVLLNTNTFSHFSPLQYATDVSKMSSVTSILTDICQSDFRTCTYWQSHRCLDLASWTVQNARSSMHYIRMFSTWENFSDLLILHFGLHYFSIF